MPPNRASPNQLNLKPSPHKAARSDATNSPGLDTTQQTALNNGTSPGDPMRWIASIAAFVLMLSPALAITIEERPELAHHFKTAGVAGVAVLYDPKTNVVTVSNRKRAETAYLPASTFKIPGALIALDTGVVKDARKDVFVHDWGKAFVPACNADQTLATALQHSCVPVFAKIGRMVGDERLKAALTSIGYGNAKASGEYPYWIKGDLRITPLQQVAFLDRLRRRDLPMSAAAMQQTTDIMELQRAGSFVLRGKTGWADLPNPDIGWLVGWAEKGDQVRVFAINIDIRENADGAKRRAIADAVLAEAGLAP